MGRQKITEATDDWAVIDEVIKAFIRRHPLDWVEWKKAMDMRRGSLYDPEYARAHKGDKDWGRLAMSFPVFQVIKKGKKAEDNLKFYLDKVAPQIFKNKALMHEFMRRYPVFVLGSKI